MGKQERFYPGDYVEALVSDQTPSGHSIKRGAMYHVDEVNDLVEADYRCSQCGDDCPKQGVQLVMPKLPDELRWCSRTFRLVYRPGPGSLIGYFAAQRSRVDRVDA